MQEINKELLQFLNGLNQYAFVENFVKIFVDAPIFLLPLFLAGMWLYYSNFLSLGLKGKMSEGQIGIGKQKLINIFYGVVFSLIISLIIQQFVHVDRPEQHLQAGAKLLLDHLPDASFPSDHATVSIAFLAGLFFSGYKKWFYIFLLPIVFMDISRIIAGVHWPFDVISGSIVGILASYFTINYFSKIKFVKKLNLEIIKLLNYIKL